MHRGSIRAVTLRAHTAAEAQRIYKGASPGTQQSITDLDLSDMQNTLDVGAHAPLPNVNGEAAMPPAAEDAFGAFNVDEYRPMRIAVIGAGASGIVAGIR